MHGHPQATAHDHAIDDGDDRLGEIAQIIIHHELLDEIVVTGLDIVPQDGLTDRADIAARTEGTVGGRVDEHAVHGVIINPFIQGLLDEINHLLVEGVERLGAVEFDHPGGMLDEVVDHLGIGTRCGDRGGEGRGVIGVISHGSSVTYHRPGWLKIGMAGQPEVWDNG